MKRKSIVVNGQEFKTQGNLKEFVQQMIDRYDDGDCLNSLDLSFCKSLLERHPDALAKIGVGVQSIKVLVTPPWKTKGFILTRMDGTGVDFSFRACVSSRGIGHRQKVNKAARTSIYPQIASFKKTRISDGLIKCAITGQLLRWEECDVDHYPVPFADLLDQYLAMSDIDIKDIKIIEECGACRFVDSTIELSFQSYHLKNAELRPLQSALNSVLGRHNCDLIQGNED